MVNGTLQILAGRHGVKVDATWTGYCRVWTVKDADGVQVFKTDDYSLLVRSLESGEGLRVGSYPPKWWPRG
jgi:hypothetical protein